MTYAKAFFDSQVTVDVEIYGEIKQRDDMGQVTRCWVKVNREALIEALQLSDSDIVRVDIQSALDKSELAALEKEVGMEIDFKSEGEREYEPEFE